MIRCRWRGLWRCWRGWVGKLSPTVSNLFVISHVDKGRWILSRGLVSMQYVSPFPGFRKTLILKRRERELRHALKNGLSSARIRKAAERVRTAKLHLLKAFHHSAIPCSAEDTAAEARL